MAEKKGFIAEFKEFIMQGNVMDLAVGVVIGAAFTAIVTSLVEDILNPLIALLGGDALVDGASSLSYTFANGVTMNYGNFIGAVINFLIIGFVLFLVVKAFNKARNAKAEAEAEEEPEHTLEEDLLIEIKDILAKK
ncbi:MAG: large conductance mechanosensitive channel protein MscL [Clostridia bacterium]|nr:large conductance mechanosensitive channel protein MscL [Clostridia bacterium]